MNSATREELRKSLPYCAGFALLFVVCYGTASWYAGLQPALPVWDFAFERHVPFVPPLALVYLTITPVLLLAPFVLRTRSEVAPLAVALSIETLIASAFFLLVPQTTSFARPEVQGLARIPFRIADTINLDFNQFPSLHVAFACSAAWAYAMRRSVSVRVGWTLWGLAVAASTWLMWEHHLADIVAGMALAAIVMGLIHPRLRARSFQEVAWAELCALVQCAHFSRRHIRYFVIFVAIYAPSLLHWRRNRAVRLGFASAQWIDDLLDGDRRSKREPFDVIEELATEMTRGSFGREALSRLTGALFSVLPAEGRAGFLALVRTMQRDRLRVRDGELWSELELNAHHRTTFSLSVDLMLLTAGCTARAAQVPHLVDALAWCSVFRDLDDDLRKGLVNIPKGVWDAPPAERERWTREEHARGAAAAAVAASEIAALDDPRARTILAIFQKSVAGFARRFDATRASAAGAMVSARRPLRDESPGVGPHPEPESFLQKVP